MFRKKAVLPSSGNKDLTCCLKKEAEPASETYYFSVLKYLLNNGKSRRKEYSIYMLFTIFKT